MEFKKCDNKICMHKKKEIFKKLKKIFKKNFKKSF